MWVKPPPGPRSGPCVGPKAPRRPSAGASLNGARRATSRLVIQILPYLDSERAGDPLDLRGRRLRAGQDRVLVNHARFALAFTSLGRKGVELKLWAMVNILTTNAYFYPRANLEVPYFYHFFGGILLPTFLAASLFWTLWDYWFRWRAEKLNPSLYIFRFYRLSQTV